MDNKNRKIFFQEIEKKYLFFRWLLIFLTPVLVYRLNGYQGNIKYLYGILALGLIYVLLINITIYSNITGLKQILKYTMHFDILFVSIILCVRGGLRSDIYVLYFIFISYNSIKYGAYGTFVSFVETILLFTIASFVFTPTQYFDIYKYIVRVIFIISFTVIVYEANKQLQKSLYREEKAKDLAYKDPLTGLYNRLALPGRYETLKVRYNERGEDFAILFFDVDNFKEINDTKGHTFGDEVLKIIGNTLINSVSKDDFACRFGGEEFLVILANTNKKGAYYIADSLRKKLSNYQFRDKKITVSVGVTMFKENYTMIENISIADKAMYDAKKLGKNQVCIAS